MSEITEKAAEKLIDALKALGKTRKVCECELMIFLRECTLEELKVIAKYQSNVCAMRCLNTPGGSPTDNTDLIHIVHILEQKEKEEEFPSDQERFDYID